MCQRNLVVLETHHCFQILPNLCLVENLHDENPFGVQLIGCLFMHLFSSSRFLLHIRRTFCCSTTTSSPSSAILSRINGFHHTNLTFVLFYCRIVANLTHLTQLHRFSSFCVFSNTVLRHFVTYYHFHSSSTFYAFCCCYFSFGFSS